MYIQHPSRYQARSLACQKDTGSLCGSRVQAAITLCSAAGKRKKEEEEEEDEEGKKEPGRTAAAAAAWRRKRKRKVRTETLARSLPPARSECQLRRSAFVKFRVYFAGVQPYNNVGAILYTYIRFISRKFGLRCLLAPLGEFISATLRVSAPKDRKAILEDDKFVRQLPRQDSNLGLSCTWVQ